MQFVENNSAQIFLRNKDQLKHIHDKSLPEVHYLLLTQVIETHLLFIEWWTEARPALLNQLQFPGIINEPLRLPDNKSLINSVMQLKNGKLAQFFQTTQSKSLSEFLSQFDADFLPVLSEFQNLHKSVINSMGDLKNWEIVKALQVLTNGKAIMEALQVFFDRWGEGPLVKTINLLRSTYHKFESFYENMHCLFCELTASLKNLLLFIFLGGSEYVGRKGRAFQIMLMKLTDCNLPYCEEKLLAVKDEDRIKILL